MQLLAWAAHRNVRPDFLPPVLWRARMLAHYTYHRVRYRTTCYYPDRVLGKGVLLDESQQREEGLSLAQGNTSSRAVTPAGGSPL